ncbi:MAG: tRNA (guanosine(46)-N7)-methyltransferase TrmB [Bdellovibrionota bacterium]
MNPYRETVLGYPGRIFCFEKNRNDAEAAKRVIAESQERIVELGSGSGNHLIGLAARHPHASCFGFEIRYKRSVRTIQKADRAGRANVFVFRADANSLVDHFAPSSIAAVYVNFPDPWERKRERKHRLLGDRLLGMVYQSLVPSGFLAVKTDHREYFETFLTCVGEDPRFQVVAQSRDLHRSELMSDNIETEFEALFRSQGLPVHYAKIVPLPKAHSPSREL